MSEASKDATGWVGAPPTSVQIAVVLIVSVIGSLMPSILPILLGGLVQEGRLTDIQLGRAAMVELLAIGVVNGLAGAMLAHTRLRLIAGASAVLLVFANLATTQLSGNAVLFVRALSGIGCGLFLWILVGLLVRSTNPARWLGIYVVLLASSALLLSSLFSGVLVPKFGINGGFAALAVMCGALGLLSLLLPSAYAALQNAQGSGSASRLPPPAGMLALLTQFFYVAGLLAVWVYVGTMARQNGNSESVVSLAFTMAFGGQIVGGLAASWLANRLPPLSVILGAGLLSIVLTAVILGGGRDMVYLAAVTGFGALWMFAAPYLLPFAAVCDSSLRAAMLATSAQLIGSAAGPALASLALVGGDVSGALQTGLGLFALALILALAAALVARRGQHSIG